MVAKVHRQAPCAAGAGVYKNAELYVVVYISGALQQSETLDA
jgi:hypothetical protein